ncbi:response regulator transcription factor [Sulfuricurvum sp.]|uniref:response regulator transcription factor n=1 Tax=Sulfuricurvum sp. TaxID=2025608 RepID=UPI002E3257D2|nr:response regulator transcription factor [Sulfuricurvum sp.]HEX5330492.1 response regulator transcription factor [Sulfuricurvum sp.]
MSKENSALMKMKRLSLLFVEDNDALRTRITEMLADYFYRVESAADGVEGLEKYHEYLSRNKPYDVVISDIRMPRMNGVEFAKELRSIREDQPIIILSAHAEAEYLLALINIGISQFITKPIEYPQMFDTLYKVCAKIDEATPVSSLSSSIVEISEEVFWDKDKKLLVEEGTAVPLTKYELVLMELLIAKFEQVCSSDEILYHFDRHSIEVSSDNLRGQFMRLRKKLPDKALSSIYGIGYRLSSVL